MLRAGALLCLLVLLLPLPLPRSSPSDEPAPPAPARQASRQSLHRRLQVVLLPSPGSPRGPKFIPNPRPGPNLGFPLGRDPEPAPDPVAASDWGSKWDLALGSMPAPGPGCQGAPCPPLPPHFKGRSGPSSVPGGPAEAALLHILSASSLPLSQRCFGALHLSWGLQASGSKLTFRLYQPQGRGHCQVWKVTCNPYLGAGGLFCSPGLGAPKWTLAQFLLPGRGWAWGSRQVIGPALEGDLHLVNSILGFRVRSGTLSLNLLQAQTGSYGHGIYYSRAAPGHGRAWQAQTHLIFYQQQGLSWLFALDRWHRLSVHLSLSPKGVAFFGIRPPRDLEVHFFNSSPLKANGPFYLLWFIPLQHPLLAPQWTFRLQLPGTSLGLNRTYTYQDRIPSASRFMRRSVLPFHPDGYAGFVEKAECTSSGLEPVILEASLDKYGSKVLKTSVACVKNPCSIKKVIIYTGPLVNRGQFEIYQNFTAYADFQCPEPYNMSHQWSVFSELTNGIVTWGLRKPVRAAWIDAAKEGYIVVPVNTLAPEEYKLQYKLTITTADKKSVSSSTFTHFRVSKQPLTANIEGGLARSVPFNERWVLNGSNSSDPTASKPTENLMYRWYCTTNYTHLESRNLPVWSTDTCLPQLSNLRWFDARDAVVPVLPETLQGNRTYYFVLLVIKDQRLAYAFQNVTVLPSPPPRIDFSCIENCGKNLVLTDRFSLSGACPDCGVRPMEYLWSIVDAAKREIPFDWTHWSTTGRASSYLSIKAYAFKDFQDKTCSVFLHTSGWGGNFLVANHSFYVNSPPRNGYCDIRPNKGIALLTRFVVRCRSFIDENLPLHFKIIASNFWGVDNISSIVDNTLGTVMYFGIKSVTPPSFLPIGMPVNHYLVTIYAQVYDSLGTFSQVTLHATVNSPLGRASPKTVLNYLSSLTQNTPGTTMTALFQKGEFVQAGYLAYLVVSLLNDVKPPPSLEAQYSEIQRRLFNISRVLPINTLEEINQVTVMTMGLTQKGPGLTTEVQEVATSRLIEVNYALKRYREKEKKFRSEQIEIVSTGISSSLSNILKSEIEVDRINKTLHVAELLASTVLAVKFPGECETVITSPSLRISVRKDEKHHLDKAFLAKKDCQNCFYPTLRKNDSAYLAKGGPISTAFYEFKEGPFAGLGEGKGPSTDVVGFQMNEITENGTIREVIPDLVEVFILRKNLSGAAFNITVGPDKDLPRTTSGVFSFLVFGTYEEVLLEIITEVRVMFKVLIYKGNNVTNKLPIASFLVPADLPPVANESKLFDPACKVKFKVPRLICLSQSLLEATAQDGFASNWSVSVVLQAPPIVMSPNYQLVNISVFMAECLNMDGVEKEWGKEDCKVGDKTSWWRIHCICQIKSKPRNESKPDEPLDAISRIKYLSARMIVIPNSIDLRMEILKTVPQNPVAVFTVVLIIFTYLVLAFWALHKDESDRIRREHVILLPDNDPYDHICYLVTFYTGSRLGAGTKADVFVQLLGKDASSDVHCLSHPSFTTFSRGSTDSFLLTTRSDLGDLRAIRVWHNNEGSHPSWYLSRVKVENIFNRDIWFFLCRSWLSISKSLEQTFPVADKGQPINKNDFFQIFSSDNLGTSHLWLSVFASVVTGPFNRLQRLSCCLTLLMNTLLCNIMFFNMEGEVEVYPRELKLLRTIMRGIESALICEPMQIVLASLFTYSHRRVKPVAVTQVAPHVHPFVKSPFQNWKERLELWYSLETARKQALGDGVLRKKQASGSNVTIPEAAANAITETKGKPPSSAAFLEKNVTGTKAADVAISKEEQTSEGSLGSSASLVRRSNAPKEGQEVEPASGESPETSSKKVLLFEAKPRFLFHWWCIYVAWLLVIGSTGVSSFFIIMYGLTYGYEKSMSWLITSATSLFESIFIIQIAKILLVSGIRSSRTKYCTNIPWTTRYNFIEIRLQGLDLNADESRELHYEIIRVRGTRMYQPLVQDEIRIFRRRKKIRDRALMFLKNIISHLIFLTLLLCSISVARPCHSFHHNQAMQNQFSLNLTTITELGDVYKWLTGVWLPLIHNDEKPTFLSNSWSKILGFPKMRQVRAKSIIRECFLSGTMVDRLMKKGIRCHSQYSQVMEDQKNYGRLWSTRSKFSLDPRPVSFMYEPNLGKWNYYSYGLSHVYGSGGYAFYFFPKQQQYNSTTRLQELQEGRWLDEKTWAVILELTTFNSDTSLFCTISIVFEASPLGVINPSLAVHSFGLPLSYRGSHLEMYLYGVALVFIVLFLIDEAVIIYWEKENYVKNVFNFLSLGLKLMFLTLILLFFVKFRLVKDLLDFYLQNPDGFTPFHVISLVDQGLGIILGFLGFLTILKTLTYSRFFYDVRLAQTAILAALPGIFHMALLVGVYIFMYVTFGYLVFGQHEWHYSNLIHSTQTIFSYCVSAFRDTAFLNKEVLGGLFLASFMLVMICVLINLFQAVILSTYEEMRQLVYEEPAAEVEAMTFLFHEARNLWRSLTCRAPFREQPTYFSDMLYGHPGSQRHQRLGLKSRNINGKRVTYVAV
ncbi:polycystic kidney disease and receptor for egg jelly-related protein [Gracilinanus agilis]|uniref:polycystic kidney disease and receptor for egg jelly-related protein n=1 Tax=Gracilinanus agilis TaxID=191870 RepID=UPI001CFEE94E|nr:polycystic kidney disease and receptor for egg jelly-related protein [Gracilinanus agilis]